MPWVYILRCGDGSYYAGSTPDIERRLAEHRSRQGGMYTTRRLPIQLVYSYETPTIEEAFYLERQVKGWRRAKKEALIRGDYANLPDLAKRYHEAK